MDFIGCFKRVNSTFFFLEMSLRVQVFILNGAQVHFHQDNEVYSNEVQFLKYFTSLPVPVVRNETAAAAVKRP